MEDRLNELPKGWVWTRLGDIGTVASGGTPSTKDEDNFIGNIPWITPADLSDFRGKFISRGSRNISEKGLKSSSAVLLPAGSILFSSRAPIGYVAIASNPISTNQGFKNLVLPKDIFNEYVFYYLKANKALAESLASGTTFLEISASKFTQVPIPLPPLPEQHRIVAKIEELFTRLDAGVEALKKIKAQLKRYRQAVLKYAFEGKLTQEWREANKDKLEPASVLLERIKEQRKKEAKGKLKELPPIDTSELPELPDGWAWTTMEQISTKVVDGVHKKPDYVSKGIPFVTVSNLTAGDEIDFQRVRYISDEDHKNFSKRANPEKGDILITKDGTLGVARVVKTENQFSIFVSVAMMKPIKKYVNSDYLAAFINSPIGQSQTRKIGEGSGLRHLHLEDLRTIPFPIAPFLEQQKIVEEIESRLSIADNLEKVAEQSLKQAERLRQSILKKAFEGKLVPQDPTDEPAEKLLERIKEEKARQEVENKKQKKDKNKKSEQMELI